MSQEVVLVLCALTLAVWFMVYGYTAWRTSRSQGVSPGVVGVCGGIQIVMQEGSSSTVPQLLEYRTQPTGRIIDFCEGDPDGNTVEFHLEGDLHTFWVKQDDPVFLDVGDCFDRDVPIVVLDWEQIGERVHVLEISEAEEE